MAEGGEHYGLPQVAPQPVQVGMADAHDVRAMLLLRHTIQRIKHYSPHTHALSRLATLDKKLSGRFNRGQEDQGNMQACPDACMAVTAAGGSHNLEIEMPRYVRRP